MRHLSQLILARVQWGESSRQGNWFSERVNSCLRAPELGSGQDRIQGTSYLHSCHCPRLTEAVTSAGCDHLGVQEPQKEGCIIWLLQIRLNKLDDEGCVIANKEEKANCGELEVWEGEGCHSWRRRKPSGLCPRVCPKKAELGITSYLQRSLDGKEGKGARKPRYFTLVTNLSETFETFSYGKKRILTSKLPCLLCSGRKSFKIAFGAQAPLGLGETLPQPLANHRLDQILFWNGPGWP